MWSVGVVPLWRAYDAHCHLIAMASRSLNGGFEGSMLACCSAESERSQFAAWSTSRYASRAALQRLGAAFVRSARLSIATWSVGTDVETQSIARTGIGFACSVRERQL